jgi:hypothetical protein
MPMAVAAGQCSTDIVTSSLLSMLLLLLLLWGVLVADMVLGWKSEREQIHNGVKDLSVKKRVLATKCGAELQEYAQALVLGHARKLQGLVGERVQMLQAAASRAVEVFVADVSDVLLRGLRLAEAWGNSSSKKRIGTVQGKVWATPQPPGKLGTSQFGVGEAVQPRLRQVNQPQVHFVDWDERTICGTQHTTWQQASWNTFHMCEPIMLMCCCLTLQESTFIHTQLVLQPLLLHKLQGVLRQLLLQTTSSSSAGGGGTHAALAASAALAGRKRLKAKRPSKAKQQQDHEQHPEYEDVLGCALLKAVQNPAPLLTLPVPTVASCNVDMDSLLGGSRFKSVKTLFSGDVAQAAKALSSLCSQKMSQQLMAGEAPSESAAAATEVHSDDMQSSSIDFDLWPRHSTSQPATAHAAAAAAGAAAPQSTGSTDRARHGQSTAADIADSAAGLAGSPANAARLAMQPPPPPPQPAPELSPVQLSGLLCDLLDVWHDVLGQHTHAHQLQQQREQLEQELEATMLQLGYDPADARAEVSKTADKRALQMCEQQGAEEESRWWRQQELPAVFGSSSQEAATQLEVVAQAAGELVERLAGGQKQPGCMIQLA